MATSAATAVDVRHSADDHEANHCDRNDGDRHDSGEDHHNGDDPRGRRVLSPVAVPSPPCLLVPSTYGEPSELTIHGRPSGRASRRPSSESGLRQLSQPAADSDVGARMATRTPSASASLRAHAHVCTRTCQPDGVEIHLAPNPKVRRPADLQTAHASEDPESEGGVGGSSRRAASTIAHTSPSSEAAARCTPPACTSEPTTLADAAEPAVPTSSATPPAQFLLRADDNTSTSDAGLTDAARPVRRAAMGCERRRCSYSMHSSYTGLEAARTHGESSATSEGNGPVHSFGGSTVHGEAPPTIERKQGGPPSVAGRASGAGDGRLSLDPAASPSRRAVVGISPFEQSTGSGLALGQLRSSVSHLEMGGDRAAIGALGQLRSSVSQPSLPARPSHLFRQGAHGQPCTTGTGASTGQPPRRQYQHERHSSSGIVTAGRPVCRPASAAAFAWRAVERRAAAERTIIQGGAAARDAAAQRVAKGAFAAATGAMSSEAAARRARVLGSTW